MAILGFWEASRPLRVLLTWSGQLRPPFMSKRIFLWLATTGSLVLLTVLSTVQLLIEAATQLGSALEILTILVTFVECCFRVAYLSARHREIFYLMAKCQSFPVSCASFGSSEREIKSNVKNRSRRVLYFFCGYVFMVLAGYLSLPFIPRGAADSTSDITASIVREYPLYIPMWTPFGKNALKVSPTYQLVVLWQAWTFIVLVSVFCCADCLLYSFIIFLHEAMMHLSRLSPQQRTSEQKSQKSNLSEDEYKIWIRQHQFILEVAADVENLFSPIILTTFLANGFVMCVLAYVLVKISDIIGILCLSGHLSCIVAKLYVMAKFGQILIDESSLLKSSMTFKAWPEMGRQRDAQIIGIRCSTPTALTGMKYFHLSIEFFGRVCSVALSYFVVLLQLH